MTVTLRRAEYPADRTALEVLFAAYLKTLFDTAPGNHGAIATKYPPDKIPELVADYAFTHLTPKGELLIAESDGLALGCGMMRALEPGVAEIQRVYVSAAARGQGLGRRLTTALMDKARADGQHTVRLDTGVNMTAAIALYTSMGFKRRTAYRRNTPEMEAILIYFERAL